MAEPGAGRTVDRRLLFATMAVIAFISIVFLWSLRGCFSGGGGDSGYTVIYSNLDLKDAANVVARLVELKVPYELKNEGTTVAVPREKADAARLGLAEKNLPLGGVVGWEIFDTAKLGATDFDRRIQLIRAISGELSRTIRRISSIDECRVQIVLPETKLFEVAKAPVTASVMIKLLPGKNLSPEQVNGIIHLVASSVENLKTENVTIIDDQGRILSNAHKLIPKPADLKQTIAESMPIIVPVTREPTKEKVQEKESQKAVKEAKPVPLPKAELTAEERALLVLKTKRELEDQLESRAQILLNRFYPPNSVIVKVNLELVNFNSEAKNSKQKSEDFTLKIKRLTAVVLVDNRFNLTEPIKEDTFSTVAGAIGYDRRRGDRIELRRVPFHYAVPPPSVLAAKVNQLLPQKENTGYSFLMPIIKTGVSVFVVVVLLIFVVVWRRRSKDKEEDFILAPQESKDNTEQEAQPAPKPESSAGASSLVGAVKKMAEESPEKLANLLKTWLSEK